MTYRTGRQSPVNIWLETDDGDVQQAMARTPAMAARLVEAANAGHAPTNAAEAFQALALRIWSGDSPMGCGDVHTIADLDDWVAKLPDDEAAAFNAMLGEGFASKHPWDSDHPVSEWVRREETP